MNWRRQAWAFDETFEASGDVRPHYRTALSILRGFSPDEIERRERLQKLALLNQGITFTVYGEKDGIERIFPFDFVPRIIPAAEWRRIEAGLVQRITTLGLFLCTASRSASRTACCPRSWCTRARSTSASCSG